MLFVLRQILRVSLLASLFACSVAITPVRQPVLKVADAFMPEVRLRKIHIVRPDLIPYPISYEIDC
ncbi:MAG TPA: hypothetical protein VG722_05255 [Tepidisphaeraceae bacterium]|nr:hypothetical protein [Tepidisphaeraceae bacterium]